MTTPDPTPANLLLQELTLGAVTAEAAAAQAKHGVQAPSNPDMTNGERLAILVEEVGEVASCLTYDKDVNALVKELLQVAAVALMWVEAIDR